MFLFHENKYLFSYEFVFESVPDLLLYTVHCDAAKTIIFLLEQYGYDDYYFLLQF